MADLSRRSFLRGFIAIAGAVAVPAVLAHESLPMIIGDGIHDDAAGLNAALNGRPFVCPSELVRANSGYVTLHGGVYRIGRTIVLEDVQTTVFVSDGRFIRDEKLTDSPMLSIPKQARHHRGVITNCYFDGGNSNSAGVHYAP